MLAVVVAMAMAKQHPDLPNVAPRRTLPSEGGSLPTMRIAATARAVARRLLVRLKGRLQRPECAVLLPRRLHPTNRHRRRRLLQTI